jgi:hypothetical protein
VNNDVLAIAAREIAETKLLLDALISSSEGFDYHKAKAALRRLEQKSRELGRLQKKLERTRSDSDPNILRVNFGGSRAGLGQ